MIKIKSIIYIGILGLALVSCNAMAGNKTESFKVYGNCGMCKKTIEKSLSDKGITGEWDKKSKIIKVTYDSTKYTNLQVQEIIAKVGYDTEKCRGNDEAYNNLHECCKYERKSP